MFLLFCWLLHSVTCVVCLFPNLIFLASRAFHGTITTSGYRTPSFRMCKCPCGSVGCRIRRHVLYVRMFCLCKCPCCSVGCSSRLRVEAQATQAVCMQHCHSASGPSGGKPQKLMKCGCGKKFHHMCAGKVEHESWKTCIDCACQEE